MDAANFGDGYRGCQEGPYTPGTILFAKPFHKHNVNEGGSSISPDVFLGSRRCPKHPNTPPFDFGAPIA